MLVGITGFGSVWRRRFGNEPRDPERFRHAAYFNTTGVSVNGRVVRHRKIAGHARFNGVDGFNPHYPGHAIGSMFECDGLCVWNGQNKVFFRRRADHAQPPDFFLVVIRSAEFGRVSVGAKGWKCNDAWLISFSEWQDQQELLLLMPPDGWVRTNIGRVTLQRDPAGSRARKLKISE
ncbi:MAG: hypothetical protein ACRD2G_13210 [Terriglobia bacterium]